MTNNGEESGFLSRWSRRKLDAGSGDALPDGPAGARDQLDVASREDEQARLRAAEEEAQAAALTEQDVEKLDRDSDYTVFLKKGVSENVRRLALRKLWVSDPLLANLDGLIDYGEEVLEAACNTENVVSAWKMGRGFLTDKDLNPAATDDAGALAKAEAGMPAALPHEQDMPEEGVAATGQAADDSTGEAQEDAACDTGGEPPDEREET